MDNKKKILIGVITTVIFIILIVAFIIVKQPQEAPDVYATIVNGEKALCVRGSYTWNYIGGAVITDSIDPREFEYENTNTILVKPGEQITFSNSSIDFTSHKFYAEEVKYYDKNNNEIPCEVDNSSIYQEPKHFTLKAPEEDGTYIYVMRLNYYQQGKAIYGLKVVVSSDPTYVISELIKYKDTFIGDASSVNSILGKLPYSKYKDGIVLRTSNKPYELIVRYKGVSLERAALQNNSIALFILIPNLDVVTYTIEDEEKTYIYTRNEIETLVGRELIEYANDTELWLKEVFYKEPLDEKGKFIDMYKIVISDAISSINGLLNEYIAIDIDSFDIEGKIPEVDKKKILDYAASMADVVIEANLDSLKSNEKLYVADGLKGTLIRAKSIENTDGLYNIIIEKIKSNNNITELIYEASIVDGQWILTEK